MNAKTYTTRGLTDHGTVLERVVDTVDGVILHTDEETRAHLRMRCAGVEQRGRCMCEVTQRHEVVGLDGPLDIGAVDADSNTHQHMLGTLPNASVELEKV